MGEPEPGAGILLVAPYRRRRDEWVYCVGCRKHPDHAMSQDCSSQHTCSGFLLRLLESVLGHCRNKAHRRFHQSSQFVGVGDQGRPAENYMGHTGPAATEMDGLRVDRTVGRSNSLTWSSRQLLTRAVIVLARWSVALIEYQIWVTALTLAPSTVRRSHVRSTRRQIVALKVSRSSSGHCRPVIAEVWELCRGSQAG